MHPLRIPASKQRHACVLVASALLVTSGCGGRHDDLLMRAPGGFRVACAKAAAVHSSWRIVCPPRIPRAAGQAFSVGGANLSVADFRDGVLLSGAGVEPPNGYGHWTLAFGRPGTLHDLLYPRDAVGRLQTFVSRPSRAVVAGRAVALYRIGGGAGLYSHHVVVAAHACGEGVQVTVHRWHGTAQATAQALGVMAEVIRACGGG